MTAWLVLFVRKHVHNLPVNDEWNFVPTYFAGWREKLAWIFAPHCEHRFIIGRTVILALFWVVGIDFRIGSYTTVVFLSVAAAALILAARKLRGKTHPADIFFPVIMLHLGHTENLQMGYQLVFTLTVMYLAYFALLVAYSDALRPATAALLGAVLLVPISLGGGQGLAFVPALLCWVVWQTLRGLWTGPRFAAAMAALIAIAVTIYTAWAAAEQLECIDPDIVRNPPDVTLRIATQVISMGLGPLGMYEIPGVGAGVFIANALCALVLLGIALGVARDRAVAGGLLVLVGGCFAFALAVGHGRESGWCSRFAAFSAMGPVVIALTIARYVGSKSVQALWFALVTSSGIAMTWANAVHGNRASEICDVTYSSLKCDIAVATPIDLLAERNVRMWDDTSEGWRTLWEHHFPLLARVPGPYSVPVIPATFAQPKPTGPTQSIWRKSYSVISPTSERIFAVRIVFHVSSPSAWEPVQFMWTDGVTGELKCSRGRPWVKPGRDETMVFIVMGSVRDGHVFLDRQECPAELLRVEFIPMQNP
jgi:hypothetical protein